MQITQIDIMFIFEENTSSLTRTYSLMNTNNISFQNVFYLLHFRNCLKDAELIYT
jgi:hypothetical protein